MRFQPLAARLAFAALMLAVLTGGAAVLGVRQGLLPDASASALIIPATVLAVLALVLALLWASTALITNRGAGKRLGLLALIGAAVFLYPPLSYVYTGLTSLPIHDVSTDTEDPPQFVALAKIHPANSRIFDGTSHIRYKGEDTTIAYALHDKYPLLTKPHAGLQTSAQTAFWRAHALMTKLGWTIVDADEKDLRIEATDKSLWFWRISDIVVRVRPAGYQGSSRLDMRAESRQGAEDHGRNAARLKAFFEQFRI